MQSRARIYYDGPPRPDTARHDLQQMLRRDGEVPFLVDAGQMRIGAGDSARTVSLKGGRVTIRLITAGSDAARILGDVGGLDKRSVIVEAEDGTRLVVHAVHALPRR